jgi:hypothetical protein
MGFVISCDGLPVIEKIDTSVLDYSFDWRKWLTPISDSISSFTVTADDGITIDSESQLNGIVTVFISGGTSGITYDVTCKITTDDGRIDSRTIKIKGVELR